MQKAILAMFLCAVAMSLAAHPHPKPQTPKYVFYFIGNGMGAASLSYTEIALAAQGKTQSLSFSSFTNVGWATVHTADNPIPTTPASATALATANKSAGGRIAISADGTRPLKSIAYSIKDMGYRVGIVTSLYVNHSVSAAFYAKQPAYDLYHQIAQDISASGFDFFAGGGFKDPDGSPNIEQYLADNGYKISKTIKDLNASDHKKNILIQRDDKFIDGLVYAVDKHSDDYTLAQMTRAAIQKLNNNKGFLLVVNSAQIDLAASDNDAAAMVGEMLEFSDAVSVAYEFYKKNPAQTLIVVTSTHETGGLSIYNGNENQPLLFRLPRRSVADRHHFTSQYPLSSLSYNDFIAMIKQDYTYGELSEEDAQQLRRLFASFAVPAPATDEQPCAIKDTLEFKRTLARFLSRNLGAYFITNKPTAVMVPVFAIGAFSSTFRGKMDNTDIPKRILNAVKK
jgi:alkaline phosphatase